jgi:hypothetical protein
MWVIVAMPSGVFILLNKWFPVFSHDLGFCFGLFLGLLL